MKLQEAIEEVKSRYQPSSPRSEDERRTTARFGKTFNINNLDDLTADEFKEFLVFKEGNNHWRNIQRYSNAIVKDMDKLRDTLKILLTESLPIRERLNKIVPLSGANHINGLGKAVVTPILLMAYPEKYAVLNSITEEGMKRSRKFPQFTNDSFGEVYEKVNNIINDLAKTNDLSLWAFDEVWNCDLDDER